MDQPLRVLLIDDNPEDRALIEQALKREFPRVRVTPVTEPRAFERALETAHDLAITDFRLSWTDGFKVLAAVKSCRPDWPVIMFTGYGDEHIAVAAMKDGLDDYIVKTPPHFASLTAAVRPVLERRRQRDAEQAGVQATEARLHQLFDRLPLGLYRMRPDGKILEANPALVQLSGCADRESLLAHNALDFFISRRNYEKWRALVDSEGTVRDFEGPARWADGRLVWVRNSVRAVRDTHGQVLFYEGAVEDITSRRRLEQEMLGEKALSENALNSLPGVFYLFDEHGRYLRWNDNLERVSGYSAAEIARMHPLDFISADEHAFITQKIAEVFQVGTAEAQANLLAKDGTRTLYHYTGRRIDVGGRPCLIGAGLDISARKHAEDALRASEAYLRAIIEAEPACVKVVGPRGELLQVNAAGLAMIEADNFEQVAGKEVLPIVAASCRDAYRAFMENVLRGNKGSLEFEIVGLKGTHRWLEAHAVPLPNPDGSVSLLSVTRDITARRHTEERLSFLAHYDGVTGLPNRTLFVDHLQQALAEAARDARLVGVLFLDLDRFKNVNDSLGHEAGDQLLKTIAERLTGAVRRGDTVARLSGDEFTIVLADMAHVEDAVRLSKKILDIFLQPFHIAGREIYITASLGVTLFPDDAKTVDGLLRNADVAMYQAKESGRNVYQFYSADMTKRATQSLALENDLHHAIERGELVLHYQPIVDCGSGRVVGVEALVRWQHSQRGIIAPAEFIPLAEDTGLIASVGEWVLRSACTQCREWRREGHTELRVAVNLSARQFRHPGLERAIMRILYETGLDPRALDLELTESAILHPSRDTLFAMQALADLGVTFSVDDFGTGYSNLSYLKRFPIDVLKVDRSFVQDIPADPDDAAIAQAIITMAHSLHMRVVAEGVETEQQSAFMRSNGCDSMQGYFFSHPLSAEEFWRLLRQNDHLELTRGNT